MNLRKSDKLIAIVGVVIIIVAAIAIVIYVPENGDGNGVPSNGDTDTTYYDIQVDEFNSEGPPKTCPFSNNGIFLSKGKSYSNKNILTINDDKIIGTVNFTLRFNDNRYSFGFIPFIFKLLNMPLGGDTVSVTITDPMGEKHSVNLQSGGKAKISITINPKDFIGTVGIFAKTPEEADMELNNDTANYTDIKDQPFSISASLTIKGKVKLFPRLVERFGKDNLIIIYNYSHLDYSIKIPSEPPSNDGDGDGETGGDTETGDTKGVQTWSTLGMPLGKL